MKTNKSYRKLMRETLKGKWRRFSLIMMVYMLTVDGISRIINAGLDELITGGDNVLLITSVNLFVSGLLIQPLFETLYTGVHNMALSAYRGEQPAFSHLLLSKPLYGRALVLKYRRMAIVGGPVYVLILLSSLPVNAIVLLILYLVVLFPGAVWFFVKATDYAAGDYLLLTCPQLSPKEILRESRLRIRGRRWQYFRLVMGIGIWMIVPVAVINFAVKNEYLLFALTSLCSAAVLPCSLVASTAFFKDLERKTK